MVSKYHRGGWRYRFKRAGKSYEGHAATQEACQIMEAQRILELGPHDSGGMPSRPRLHDSTLGRTSIRTSESPTLFTTLSKKYLLTHVRGRLTDEAHVERSLNRFAASWPGKKIADIQVDDVEAWARARLMTEHRGKPIKGATVNRDLAHLSAFFTWAINHRLAADNPASPRRVKLYPEPWRAYQSLTAPQIAQVLDLAPDPEERAKVALLALTGQRRGVIVDMTWQQVDLSGRMLTYRSKRLDRSIPLSDQVIGILRSLGPRPDGYVFRNRSKDHTRRWWVQATRAIGMPNLRLHDLRVTFARLLADQGEDLITIMACMGHSKVTTTQRYIPIYRGQVQGAMGKMGAMIDLSVGGLSRRGDRAQGPEAHDNDDLVGDL